MLNFFLSCLLLSVVVEGRIIKNYMDYDYSRDYLNSETAMENNYDDAYNDYAMKRSYSDDLRDSLNDEMYRARALGDQMDEMNSIRKKDAPLGERLLREDLYDYGGRRSEHESNSHEDYSPRRDGLLTDEILREQLLNNDEFREAIRTHNSKLSDESSDDFIKEKHRIQNTRRAGIPDIESKRAESDRTDRLLRLVLDDDNFERPQNNLSKLRRELLRDELNRNDNLAARDYNYDY